MADEAEERIVEEYTDPQSGDTFKHGERVRIISDAQEDDGIFEGTEGKLHICEVGAPEYGNVRTVVLFHEDGMTDPGDEVHLDNIEEID